MNFISKTVSEEYRAAVTRVEGEPDPRLVITIIRTTPEATLAALRTAGGLAKSLEARIELVATEVVPCQLPLDQPRVPVAFVESSLRGFVVESNLDADEVRIEICLCRDRRQCLQQILRPRSLVVLGGKRYWWSNEYKLQRWLGRLGHRVVFVDVTRHRPEAVNAMRDVCRR